MKIQRTSLHSQVVLGLLLLTTAPLPSLARQATVATSPTLTGLVVDATGVVLAGAAVEVRRVRDGEAPALVALVQADREGRFRTDGLPAGIYRVSVACRGSRE
jgi:hypothetical protein